MPFKFIRTDRNKMREALEIYIASHYIEENLEERRAPLFAMRKEAKKASFIALLVLCKEILEACIDVLGFEAPDRM